jgi:hypothetical protein
MRVKMETKGAGTKETELLLFPSFDAFPLIFALDCVELRA